MANAQGYTIENGQATALPFVILNDVCFYKKQ